MNIDCSRKVAAFIVLGCAIALLSGCSGSSGSSSPQMVQGTGQFGNLSFTTTTEASQAPGVPFTIAYTLTNAGSTPLVVAVPGPLIDATVTSGAYLVWQLSKTTGEADGWAITTIQPGQIISGTYPWNQTDLTNHQVAPGQYSLTAWSPVASVGSTSYTDAQAQVDFATSPVTVTVL